jgi:hypothetical protein
MKLVQISNLFNQICLAINQANPQARRVGFYHYGWYSDVNTNVQNNWTGQNTVGVVYPSVQLLYPTASVEIKEKSVKGTLQCRLIFSDLQYYNNDASVNQRSIIEVQSDLEDLVVNVLSEFNRIGRTKDYQCGITTPITIDYLSDAHNNSLVLLDCSFTIYYIWDCPVYPADISLLSGDFADVPPPIKDLEQE